MAEKAPKATTVKMPKTIKSAKITPLKLPNSKISVPKPIYPKIVSPKASKGLSGYMSTKGSGTSSNLFN